MQRSLVTSRLLAIDTRSDDKLSYRSYNREGCGGKSPARHAQQPCSPRVYVVERSGVRSLNVNTDAEVYGQQAGSKTMIEMDFLCSQS